MASTYNGSVANLVDPLANSPLNSPSHAGQHTEINDALQTLGTWTTFTPTWTSLTAGNATQSWRYTIFNKMMAVNGTLTFGSTTSMGSEPRMTIPNGQTAVERSWGVAQILDSGSDNYFGGCIAIGTTIYLYNWELSSSHLRLRQVTATSPFTWAVNDQFWFTVVFPIA